MDRVGGRVCDRGDYEEGGGDGGDGDGVGNGVGNE